MAVYKTSYCFPFSNSIDIRTALTGVISDPVVWLSCQVNTSNKLITGYSIKILDQNNNQIFPISDNILISPIEELQGLLDNKINTGENGSLLQIPFFQNKEKLKTYSYNAVYYKPKYMVDFYVSDYTDNWSYDSSGDKMVSTHGNIIIDDIYIQKNDLVLITSGTYEGLWKAEANGDLTKYYENGSWVASDALANKIIVVKKGTELHNKTFKRENLGWLEYSGSLWEDVEADEVDFENNKEYKWVITLYEGSGKILGSSVLRQIVYNNLTIQDCDTLIGTGTVFGSTVERIQISNTSEDKLPYGNINDPLILQTRFGQLLDSSGKKIGSRFYVNSYVTRNGYVYTQTGSITSDQIKYASTVSFYKHSNNEQDILDQDIVYTASDQNIDLSVIHSSGEIIGGAVMTESKQRILLMNQNNPAENGVYYFETENIMSRANGYTEWANFIGKVLYVQNGTYQGENFISLAGAHGTLYSDTVLGQTGSSPLIFKKEMPLILFPEFENIVDLCYNEGALVSEGAGVYSITNNKADSILLSEGMTVYGYRANSGIYEAGIFKVNSNLKLQLESTPSVGSLIKVLNGKVFGGEVIKVINSNNIPSENVLKDYSVYRAKVLKNTTTKTYITPLEGISDFNILYFPNNEFLNSSGEKIQFLKIQKLNSVVWSVTHSELQEPLVSEKNTGTGSPYKYEVRSFFKESGENPFKVIEYPFLNIFLGSDNQVEISTRELQAIGKYIQYGDGSWESYRWILRNEAGKVVQDTGVKYKGQISTIFYGMINDEEVNKYYTVELLVSDNFNNTLSNSKEFYLIPVTGDQSIKHSTMIANYDCNTHSVLISVSTNIESIYTYTQKGNEIIPDTIDGNNFSYNDERLSITGTNAGGFNIYGLSDFEKSGASLTVYNGVNYGYYFLDEISTISANEQEITIDNNQLSLQTEILLDSNNCGEIYRIELENNDNEKIYIGLIIDPITKTLTTVNSSLYASLKYYNLEKGINRLMGYLVLHEIGTESYTDTSFGLGYTNSIDDRPYSMIVDSESNKYPWYFTRNGRNFNSRYFLGNLCLTGDNSPSLVRYWNEARPALTLISISGRVNTMNVSSSLPSKNDMLIWPADDSSYYWRETSVEENYANFPAFFTEVTGSETLSGGTPYYSEVYMYPRYGTLLDNKKIILYISINNLELFLADGVEIMSSTSGNVTNITVSYGATEIGHITMTYANSES